MTKKIVKIAKHTADHVAGAAIGAAIGTANAVIGIGNVITDATSCTIGGAYYGANKSISKIKKGWEDHKKEREG